MQVKVYKPRQADPAKAADRQAQTGTRPGRVVHWDTASIPMVSGVKYRPKVTENGHSERENLRWLSARLGAEQATRPQAAGE